MCSLIHDSQTDKKAFVLDLKRTYEAVLEEALSGLAGNSSVMIYPEGTRSRDGALQPFKKGGFWMALQAGLPIVPVRVSGTREIVAAGTLAVKPGAARIEIFPPIETLGKTPADIPGIAHATWASADTGVSDIAMDPESPDILYAAAYTRRRTPFGFNGGGPGSDGHRNQDSKHRFYPLSTANPSAVSTAADPAPSARPTIKCENSLLRA